MSDERQIIEEMARDICNLTVSCEECVMLAHKTGQSKEQYCKAMRYAERAYNAGYRKQSVGEWEWFEEWSPSTTDHPRECDDCGWRCGECKTALEDVVGGYWDDPDKKPNLNFCPNCGARMKGGAE